MLKRDPEKQVSFAFDEQGVNEVSEQIMNSYNSGFVDDATFLANLEEFQGTEG